MKRYKIMISVISFILAVLCFSVPAHAAERFVIKYDKKLDITQNQIQFNVEDYAVRVDMTRPAEPFKEIIFRVFVSKENKPVELTHGYMLLNMSMDMGLYKAKLVKADTGYTAKVVLPKCIFGGKRWFVKTVLGADTSEYEKVFMFDMKE